MRDLKDNLDTIARELAAAADHLAALRVEMSRISAAGMYPAVPTERFKDGRYLYLYFPTRPAGLDLDAKSRLYIGRDPDKIDEARRLVANRQEWERLDHLADRLDTWVKSSRVDLSRLAQSMAGWPRDEVILGQPGAAGSRSSGPNR